jgi:hypothetical protein
VIRIVSEIVISKTIFFKWIVLACNLMISWNLVVKIKRILPWLRKKNKIMLVINLMIVKHSLFRLLMLSLIRLLTNLILLIMLFRQMRRLFHRMRKSVRLKKIPNNLLLRLNRVFLRFYLIYYMEQGKLIIIYIAILDLIGMMLYLNRFLICLQREILNRNSLYKI